jgi:membrane-associated phospholipid phosphatase
VSEAAQLVRTEISEFIATHGPAEAAIVGLALSAAVFAAGYSYRAWRWRSASLQTLGLLMVVAVLALQVRAAGWLTGLDHPTTGWLVAHRNPGLEQAAVIVTGLLGPVETALLAVIFAAVAVWTFRSLGAGLVVIATVGGAVAICSGIRFLVGRTRPPVGVQETLGMDHSFPSGNVTGTAALFGIVAVTIGLSRSRFLRGVLAAMVVVAVATVAASHLYLGVHWLTDVVAGALVAAAAVTLGAAAMRMLTESAPAPKDQEVAPIPDREALV